MIEASGITKSYKDKPVLKDISFDLKQGELLVAAGENGAGKSTLLSIMATLMKPDSGRIIFDGEDIVKKPQRARASIVYIPQEISLHMNLTVRENLDFWAAMNGLDKARRSQEIERLVTVFKLGAYEKTKARKLSAGYKRRLNIAVGMFREPKLMIMDEPTVGIDAETRRDILDFVLDIKKKGAAVLYVTHMPDEINILADTVLLLSNGEKAYYGSPAGFSEGGAL